MALEVRVEEEAPRRAAVVRYRAVREAIGPRMARAFGEIMAALASRGLRPEGMPFATYPAMAPGEGGEWEILAGVPVAEEIAPEGDVVPWEIPGGRVAVAVHVGPYETLGETYEAMRAWIAANGLAPAGPMREHYLTDPRAEPDPSRWRTEIRWPVGEAG